MREAAHCRQTTENIAQVRHRVKKNPANISFRFLRQFIGTRQAQAPHRDISRAILRLIQLRRPQANVEQAGGGCGSSLNVMPAKAGIQPTSVRHFAQAGFPPARE